jgi:isopenicillin N synthase-like dioxygenase
VDVSGLYSPDVLRRREAAHALGKAAREAGFFYLFGHRVSETSIQGVLAQARCFFALPTETKLSYHIGRSSNHRGYVPPGEEVFYGGSRDQKEAFDLCNELPANDPDVVAGTPLLGPNVWPDLPGFREDVGAYYREVLALGRLLLAGFALALGLRETYFDRFVKKPPSQLRLLHYPPSADAEAGAGIGSHTDYECFTILLATSPGLEVMNGSGEWVDAPAQPGAFVVNIGDLLEIWSNGSFLATSHRVRKVASERYSFPLFFACDYWTEVAPLSELITPDRPAAYGRLIAGEHLYAQTIQSFSYLKQRLARGEIALPAGARPLSSFGQEARVDPGLCANQKLR